MGRHVPALWRRRAHDRCLWPADAAALCIRGGACRHGLWARARDRPQPRGRLGRAHLRARGIGRRALLRHQRVLGRAARRRGWRGLLGPADLLPRRDGPGRGPRRAPRRALQRLCAAPPGQHGRCHGLRGPQRHVAARCAQRLGCRHLAALQRRRDADARRARDDSRLCEPPRPRRRLRAHGGAASTGGCRADSRGHRCRYAYHGVARRVEPAACCLGARLVRSHCAQLGPHVRPAAWHCGQPQPRHLSRGMAGCVAARHLLHAAIHHGGREREWPAPADRRHGLGDAAGRQLRARRHGTARLVRPQRIQPAASLRSADALRRHGRAHDDGLPDAAWRRHGARV